MMLVNLIYYTIYLFSLIGLIKNQTSQPLDPCDFENKANCISNKCCWIAYEFQESPPENGYPSDYYSERAAIGCFSYKDTQILMDEIHKEELQEFGPLYRKSCSSSFLIITYAFLLLFFIF